MASNDPKGLAVLPFLGKQSDSETISQAIGVEPIINCRGTFTIIGGSVERPEVLQAMEAAAGYFAQYDEMAAAVGQRLADITGAEWGLIASGCAAAIKHVTIACVTGGNPEKLIRVPDLTGFDKNQVIIPGYCRNAYDHAVRNVGVEIVMVETPEELEEAINPRTAMIYLTTGRADAIDQPLSLEVIAEVADCGVEQAKLAADNAQRGFESWRKTTAFERAALLKAWHQAMLEAKETQSYEHGLDVLDALFNIEPNAPMAHGENINEHFAWPKNHT